MARERVMKGRMLRATLTFVRDEVRLSSPRHRWRCSMPRIKTSSLVIYGLTQGRDLERPG
jgi:hypothetical protein